MDCVFVKLGIYKYTFHVCYRLPCEWTCTHNFLKPIKYEFHCLVQVLDTFGHVDVDVGIEDANNAFCFFFVHAEFNELLPALKFGHIHVDIPFLDSVDNLKIKRFYIDIESVMPVRGLSFNRFDLLLYGFPVNNNRLACGDFHIFIPFNPVGNNLKVKFSHASQQVFPSFLIKSDLKSRVFLCNLSEYFDQLWQIFCVFSFHSHSNHRFTHVPDTLKRRHVFKSCHSRSYDCFFKTGNCSNISCRDLVNFKPFRTHEDAYLLDSGLLYSA